MIDIHHNSSNLERLKITIKNSTKITERDKLFLHNFSADCTSGWGEKKLTPGRILKLLSNWAKHDYRIVLRKFVSWMLNEYGYPQGYPEEKEMARLLPILKYPGEVNKIKVKQPEKQKSGEDIPTEEEMQYLSNASINPMDKAFFEMAKQDNKANTHASIQVPCPDQR
jgi:hypothetical protein